MVVFVCVACWDWGGIPDDVRAAAQDYAAAVERVDENSRFCGSLLALHPLTKVRVRLASGGTGPSWGMVREAVPGAFWRRVAHLLPSP